MLKQTTIGMLVLALLASTAAADKQEKRQKVTSCAMGFVMSAGICVAIAGHPELGKAMQDTGSKAVKSIGDSKEDREKVKRERDKTKGNSGAPPDPKRVRDGRGDRDRVATSPKRLPKVTKKPITKPQRIAPQRSPRPPFKRR